MGSKDEDANLNAEVTSRLDELFGDEEPEDSSIPEIPQSPVSSAPADQAAAADDVPPSTPDQSEASSPVDALKALVFSIDWEITDTTMKDFLKEVKRLKKQYADDRISLMFLKLHESIGKYIKSRKAKSHPDALKLLTSLYQQFEKTFASPGLSDAEKKKLVAREVKKYKRFQQDVLSSSKAPESSEKVSATPAPEAESQPGRAPAALSAESRELADHIVSELRQTIQAEFQALRQLLAGKDG